MKVDVESDAFRHMMRSVVLAVLMEIFENTSEREVYNIIHDYAEKFVKEQCKLTGDRVIN